MTVALWIVAGLFVVAFLGPAAVIGLALLRAGAVVVHVRRGDGVVAVGRFGPAAF